MKKNWKKSFEKNLKKWTNLGFFLIKHKNYLKNEISKKTHSGGGVGFFQVCSVFRFFQIIFMFDFFSKKKKNVEVLKTSKKRKNSEEKKSEKKWNKTEKNILKKSLKKWTYLEKKKNQK